MLDGGREIQRDPSSPELRNIPDIAEALETIDAMDYQTKIAEVGTPRTRSRCVLYLLRV